MTEAKSVLLWRFWVGVGDIIKMPLYWQWLWIHRCINIPNLIKLYPLDMCSLLINYTLIIISEHIFLENLVHILLSNSIGKLEIITGSPMICAWYINEKTWWRFIPFSPIDKISFSNGLLGMSGWSKIEENDKTLYSSMREN